MTLVLAIISKAQVNIALGSKAPVYIALCSKVIAKHRTRLKRANCIAYQEKYLTNTKLPS